MAPSVELLSLRETLPSDSTSSSEVTGPVVFWALLAIVLNAMAQDSPTARQFRDTAAYSEGLLTPWLSSPIFCGADICVDLYRMVKDFRSFWDRRTSLTGDDRSPEALKAPSSSQLVAVRIVLVVFGVLPQAVRLYGMSGVPWTKALATIYMTVALTRLFRTAVHSKSVMLGSSQVGQGSTQDVSPTLSVELLMYPLHAAAYLWLWNGIAGNFRFDRETHIYQILHNGTVWFETLLKAFAMLVILAVFFNCICTIASLDRYSIRTACIPSTSGGWFRTLIIPIVVPDTIGGCIELMADPPERKPFPQPSAVLPVFLVRLAPFLALALLSSWLLVRVLLLIIRFITSLFKRFVLRDGDVDDEGSNAGSSPDEYGLVFAFFNLITAGVWFSIVWNGYGTTMPAWEGWFG